MLLAIPFIFLTSITFAEESYKVSRMSLGVIGGAVPAAAPSCTTALGTDMTGDVGGGVYVLGDATIDSYFGYRFQGNFPATATLCSITFMMRTMGGDVSTYSYRASVWNSDANYNMDKTAQIGGYSDTVSGSTFNGVTIVPVTFAWTINTKPSMTLNGIAPNYTYYVVVEQTVISATNYASAAYAGTAHTYSPGYWVGVTNASPGTLTNYGANDASMKMLQTP